MQDLTPLIGLAPQRFDHLWEVAIALLRPLAPERANNKAHRWRLAGSQAERCRDYGEQKDPHGT